METTESANPLWRHGMQTLAALAALCEGNPPVTGPPVNGFLSQRAGDADWDFFFDVSLNN